MKKNFSLCALVALLAVVFVTTSCSKDDETPSFDSESILGTWEIQSMNYAIALGDWGIEVHQKLTFKGNSRCTTGIAGETSYKVEDGLIKTYNEYSETPMFIYQLVHREGNKMHVRAYKKVVEEGKYYNIHLEKK